MKKVLFISSVFLCCMMMLTVPADAQTRKEKKAAQKAEWEFQQKMKEMERQRALDSIANLASPANEVFQKSIPCYAESRSDKEYYRELGEGEDTKRNVARLSAVKMAQSMMRERLAHSVKGLSTDYSKLVNKSGKDSDLEQKIEGEMMNVVDAVLNDADNPCEEWSQDRSGRYHVYYVIEIKKNEIADKFAEAISKSDKLQIDFDRERFRQFAKEYMQRLQEYEE
ncbi:MAG: hypothetical protein IKG81_07480 [Bacteroidales bacterium]|nr:hypothetical protein [Bacteroidales bacterium]